MKSRFLLLGACALLLGGRAHAQVQPNVSQDHHHTFKATPYWEDNFDGTAVNPNNWGFETGNGTKGWGNNEWENYQADGANTSVGNGKLTITARKEFLNGSLQYTSARMKAKMTDIHYGRIEASIEVPMSNGMWPAFWMLGSNIATSPWPQCGEIDIMERVNARNRVTGTQHWYDSRVGGDGHVQKGYDYDGMSLGGTGFHTYAVEWDDVSICTWVDNVKYHEFPTNGGPDHPTDAFKKNFFVMLNLAVGGDMPFSQWTNIYNVDSNFTAAYMNVDWVRAYDQSTVTPPPPPPTPPTTAGQLEAENANVKSGMTAESCSEGGQDMGYIQAGGFLTFNNINFPTTGTYLIEYRVASGGAGGTISCDLNAGTTQLGATTIPGTGGWQTWTTVSRTVWVNAGTYNFGVYAQTAGYNLNWIRITPQAGPPPPPPFSMQLEAESASVSRLMTVEGCSEGGQDMGNILQGGFLTFNNITFPTSGSYLVEYRVASGAAGGTISCDLNGGTISLGLTTIPGTGGWQNWTTVSKVVNVNAGTYNFGVFAQTAGYNLNWIRITKQGAARGLATAVNAPVRGARPLQFYPNPVTTSFVVDGLREAGELTLRDYLGRICLHQPVEANERVDISTLPVGIYVLTVRTAEGQLVQKLVKQ